MSWSKKYKRSIDCENPSGFSQRAHCDAREKRAEGKETESKSPFVEEVKGITFSKFSHITPHLKGKKHQIDPNIDLKQLVHHATVQYLDRDVDGDVDIFDDPKKQIPDENPISGPFRAEVGSRRLLKKQKGELKHTRRGMAYEETTECGDVTEGNRDGKSAKDPDYSLHDWFKGGGWVQAGGKYDGKPCARQPGQKTKPFCRDADDRASMTKKERNRRARKKRREDPNPERRGKAKMVGEDTCPICNCDPCQCLEGTLQEKKDACYHKVKSRYKVWPSAYASGALVKCRKVGADSWGNQSEEIQMIRYCPKCQKDETSSECKYGSKYWEMFSIPSSLTPNQMKFDIAQVHPANEEKDHEYSMARSELSTIISAAKRLRKKMKGEGSIEAWVQSKITKAADYIDTAADYVESGEHNVDEAKKCWPGYEKKGTQELFGKPYNRCVRKEQFSNWREELAEDWQKVNRQDKTDGLSQAAVDAYRRENPGSKLQTAVTEKKPKGKRAKRRENFCRRMKGMKSKLTSAKTARDPDSRINKALRRWNCN